MRIYRSAVYDRFHCIAAECPDSCCHEWSIGVDAATADLYRRMPGELGCALRHYLNEDNILTLQDNRCPMWREDGLCRIHAELGHDALCQTCRDFPRLTHDYGDFREFGLELSCPEAARLILNTPPCPMCEAHTDETGDAQYDPQDMDILLRTRTEAFAILRQNRPVAHLLALLLLYGYEAQAQLDGCDPAHFDPQQALRSAAEMAAQPDTAALIQFFRELEILTPRWRARLDHPQSGSWNEGFRSLAHYFVERYWLQAISDLDLIGRVKLCVISCCLIFLLGGDLISTAQLYSKEIENDPDNMDAILDGAYASHALTDDKLLGLLLRL